MSDPNDARSSREIDCPAGCGDELNDTVTEVYAHLVLDCPEVGDYA